MPPPAPPSPRRRAQPEAALQRAVVRLLRQVVPGAIVHHSANSVPGKDATAQVRQAILAGLGVHAGFSDLIVLAQGKVVFLELKAPSGAASAAQRDFAAAVKAQGHVWRLVRNLDDALDACTAAGMTTRVVR